MSATIFSWARRSAPRDWTNDELAELYRVEHALSQAGIAVETDRNCSDEGDPWFVFCHPDGHVVVHIARMGGLYHLYCATLPEPLIGPNFAAITKAFVAAIPAPARSGAGGRVVAHPSALLSLLVAAAMFSADALLRHSAHAAELTVLPHGHLPLNNLPSSGVKKSEALKEFADTFAAAVWRGPDAAAQEAVWRAVEDAAVGFSVLTAVTLAFDAEGSAQPIGGVAPAPDAAPAPVSADSSVRVDAEEVGDWTVRPEASGGGVIASNMVESRSIIPAVLPAEWIVETGLGSQAIPVDPSPAASVPAAALSAVAGMPKAAVSGGVPLAPNIGETRTLDVALAAGGETIDLGQADALWQIVVSGHGALTVRNAQAAESIEVARGAHAALTLDYDKPASGDTISQSLALDGGTQVSVTPVVSDPSNPTPPGDTTEVSVAPVVPLDPPKPPPIHLVVDSQGTQSNDLSIVDPGSATPASININVTGTQNLTLNESGDSFADSSLDASTLVGSLTVALDLSNGDLNDTHLIFGSGNFVATPEDNIALENLPNDARIDLGIDLNIVILAEREGLISSSGPMALTIDLGPLGAGAAPIAISEIEASGVADLFVTSPSGVNSVQTIEDATLANLDLSGAGSVEIGSLTGIAASDGQSVVIDASKLTGILTLDASGIADIAAGGRHVSIMTGSGASIVSDINATESLNFVIGAGQALINIAGGATLVAISGLKVTDQVNIGTAFHSDTFINGLNMLSRYQSGINASGSLVTAATTAAGLVNSTGQHQAVLFSYLGNNYVFVDAVGNHIFNPSFDAIVKLTGVTPASDLSGVFHSA